MPFSRPTLTALREQAAANIASQLPNADALLRFSNLGILGDVEAGLVNGLYGYLDWIARQSVPFTATDEYLEGWAALKSVTRKPAVSATGVARFPGTNGKVVPAGSEVFRSDGFRYVTTADATVAGGFALAPIAASTGGTAGNASSGVGLTLGIGISGVTATGTAEGPISGGLEIESDDDLRNRMIEAYSSPSQGGSEDDYIRWSLEVPGVTRAWVRPSGMGPGTVVVYFMMDQARAAFGGFPQGTDGVATNETRDSAATGDQLILADALYGPRPVTALVYAVAPQPNTVSLTIAGISAAPTAVKNAVASAFATALRAGAVPGGSTDISTILGAIAAVPGTAGFVLTNVAVTHGTVNPGAAGNIQSDPGYLPVPGAITYT